MSKTIVSIDPGINGGIVYGTCIHDACAVSMPETAHDLRDLIRDILVDAHQPVAYLEKVGGYGGNSSMTGHAGFVFGFNAGACLATLACLEVPVHRPTPQQWQGALKLPAAKHLSKAQHKARLKARAQELFANQKVTLKTADAFLMFYLASEGLI